MRYVAYLFASGDSMPDLEVVPAEDIWGARARARELLALHETATFAEIWQDNRPISTVLGHRKPVRL
jgi:hypothetical protein